MPDSFAKLRINSVRHDSRKKMRNDKRFIVVKTIWAFEKVYPDLYCCQFDKLRRFGTTLDTVQPNVFI